MEEKISIVVFVKNEKRGIAACLDTLISQTYKNIEIICVTNSPSNAVLEIIESYAKFDSRIKMVNSFDKNTVLELVEGRYVLFAKSDFWFNNVLIEHASGNAIKNDVDVVIFDGAWHKKNPACTLVTTIKEFKNYYVNKSFSADKMGSLTFKLMPVNPYTKLYRTELLKGLTLDNDIILWAEIFVRAQKITYLNEPLILFGSENDVCKYLFDMDWSHLVEAYKKVVKIFKASGYYDNYKLSIQALMVVDFMRKYNLLPQPERKIFFNKLKSLNLDLDYKQFTASSFNPLEISSVNRFEMLNSMDFDIFEVNNV